VTVRFSLLSKRETPCRSNGFGKLGVGCAAQIDKLALDGKRAF